MKFQNYVKIVAFQWLLPSISNHVTIKLKFGMAHHWLKLAHLSPFLFSPLLPSFSFSPSLASPLVPSFTLLLPYIPFLSIHLLLAINLHHSC